MLIERVGYNPQLQRRVAAEAIKPDRFEVTYGISTRRNPEPADVAAFHSVGAAQTDMLPPVSTLVVPSGSANSTTSILYGLTQHRPPTLDRVVLVGIGPNKANWIEDRLAAITEHDGTDFDSTFTRHYRHPHDLIAGHGPIAVEHYDLHTRGIVKYGTLVPWSEDGINFHPNYEGKVLRWLTTPEGREVVPGWTARDSTACVWIVGSDPSARHMEAALQ